MTGEVRMMSSSVMAGFLIFSGWQFREKDECVING
jgi:hypothetical protein